MLSENWTRSLPLNFTHVPDGEGGGEKACARARVCVYTGTGCIYVKSILVYEV